MSAGILLPNQYKRLEELLVSAGDQSSRNPNTDITVSIIFRNGYPRIFSLSLQERCEVPEDFKKNFSAR